MEIDKHPADDADRASQRAAMVATLAQWRQDGAEAEPEQPTRAVLSEQDIDRVVQAIVGKCKEIGGLAIGDWVYELVAYAARDVLRQELGDDKP